MTTPGKMNTRI